jgi:hypothetical protein
MRINIHIRRTKTKRNKVKPKTKHNVIKNTEEQQFYWSADETKYAHTHTHTHTALIVNINKIKYYDGNKNNKAGSVDPTTSGTRNYATLCTT